MTFERDHDRASARSSDETLDDTRAAGRVSASASLERKANPTRSGLLDRSARDANGIRGDADELVERADASSGAPLPASLRASFEASLGVGLGDVRVHTGAASAAASDAVDAHAYTVGNDIHFGDGAFDPESPQGQRLIAHEVVHTVQQGGAPRGAQFKLRVSSPGDAHELEADAFAERMVAGARSPATISRVATGLHRWRRGESYGFVPWTSGTHADKANNPSCAWNATAPIDYVAQAQPAGPSQPSPAAITVSIGQRGWPKPRGALIHGKEYDASPAVVIDKACNAIEALEHVAEDVTTTHNAAAADVRAYNTAASEVKEGGTLGPSPSGVNWQPGKTGKETMGELADQQTPHGGKTSINDLYTPQQSTQKKNPFDQPSSQPKTVMPSADQQKLQGIDDKTKGAAKVEDTSKALSKAKTDGDVGVKSALRAYSNHMIDIATATNDVKIAYASLDIEKTTDDKEKAEKAKSTLEAEKADVIAVITGASTVITKGAKVLAGDLDTKAEVLVAIASKAVDGFYLKDIEAQEKKIKGAKSRIRSLEGSKVKLAVENAELKLSKAVSELQSKAELVAKALKARQDLYDEAAKTAEAKAIAGGASAQQADRLRTAIAAIPRLELVVAKLEGLIGKIGIPGYNPTAGLAFAIAKGGLGTNDLVNAIGNLKTWYGEFSPELTKWKSRLMSARQLADGLNIPGT